MSENFCFSFILLKWKKCVRGISFALSYDDLIFTTTLVVEIKLKTVDIRRIVEANLGQFSTSDGRVQYKYR